MSSYVKRFKVKERVGEIVISLLGLALLFTADRMATWISSILNQGIRLTSTLTYGFEHLGVVLVLAMLVRVAIEEASQRQFLNVVNDEIEKSIKNTADRSLEPLKVSIGKLDEELGFAIRRRGVLDDESAQVLKEKLLNPTFIRPQYDLSLTLEPLLISGSIRSDLLKVHTRTSYTVENITNQPAPHTVRSWVDTMFEPEWLPEDCRCRFTRFEYGHDIPGGTDVFDLQEFIRMGKVKRENGALWLEYTSHEAIPAKARYKVTIQSSQVFRMCDLFVWNMSLLTKKMDISVLFSGGLVPEKFHVGARPLHHLGTEVFQNTFRNNGDLFEWSINQVLLPYQGVEVWWLPREAPV